MMQIPVIHSKDLREQLERFFVAERRHHVFAFFGTGAEEELRLEGGHSVRVLPVRSELDLREQLVRLGDEDRVAFLVPFEHDVPMDLAGRFAKNGRVQRIGAELRLRRLFGAKEVDSEAKLDPLAGYLLRHEGDQQFTLAQGVLTRDAMWQAWLGRALGLDCTGGLALDDLLGFVAQDAKGPQFVKGLEAKGEADFVGEIRNYFASQLHAAGACLFDAWAKGQGMAALELALLAETLWTPVDTVASVFLRMRLEMELGVKEVPVAKEVLGRLGGAVGGALMRRFKGPNRAVELRKIYEAAESRVGEPSVREALVGSPRLPYAFRARLDRYGAALSACVEDRSAAAFEKARAAYQDVSRHEAAQHESEIPTMRRADRALRLLAFLVADTPSKLESSPSAYARAEILARWYVGEGGFVDWARYQVRGPATDPFGIGVTAVVDAADALREKLDRDFGRALGKWIEANRPAQQLIPIERALDRVAVPFLEKHTDRRLLVLLVDGMAWAQAVELLLSLGESTTGAPWAPLAYRGWATGGGGSHPVVMAALPTITEVSRAAFFAGQLVPDGTSENTGKDPERFRQHKGLGKLCPGASAPRLMLQGDAFGPDGHLAQPARTMILDTKSRVVGVVVNAIDDALKSNPQMERRWTSTEIRALPELLNLARESGRTILLASDHGHVPSDRLETVGTVAGGGARWRPWWKPEETILEQELGFKGDGVRTPKGAYGVVLPIDDRPRYISALHAGEHGGATLAEVVTPCLLLGCALDDHGDDPATRVVPADAPRWWHLEVQAQAVTVEEPAPTKPPKKKVSDAQLSLLGPTPEVAPPAPPKRPSTPPAPSTYAMAAPLTGSALFDARAPKGKKEREEVLRAVDFLLARNNVVSVEAFAAAVGLLAYRVPGHVSLLQSVLNVDGYQVLALEPSAKLVRLDAEKLAQQFGVHLGGKP